MSFILFKFFLHIICIYLRFLCPLHTLPPTLSHTYWALYPGRAYLSKRKFLAVSLRFYNPEVTVKTQF